MDKILSNRGLTLLELMASIAIGAIAMSGMIMMSSSMAKTFLGISAKDRAQTELATVMTIINNAYKAVDRTASPPILLAPANAVGAPNTAAYSLLIGSGAPSTCNSTASFCRFPHFRQTNIKLTTSGGGYATQERAFYPVCHPPTDSSENAVTAPNLNLSSFKSELPDGFSCPDGQIPAVYVFDSPDINATTPVINRVDYYPKISAGVTVCFRQCQASNDPSITTTTYMVEGAAFYLLPGKTTYGIVTQRMLLNPGPSSGSLHMLPP